MNYLAIDTSSNYLTVALCYGGKYYGQTSSCALTHSATLNLEIERVLSEAGATLQELDFFACVIGAGSFTGIRIGVSAVKAFSFALDKPVLGVTSFDVLAYNTDRRNTLALIDARNNNFYACAYKDGKAQTPEFISGESLKDTSYKIITPSECDLFKGLILAVEDNQNNLTDRESLLPLYVKKSQAEEC